MNNISKARYRVFFSEKVQNGSYRCKCIFADYCVSVPRQRHGQSPVTPVAPQRTPLTKHLLNTAHNVGRTRRNESRQLPLVHLLWWWLDVKYKHLDSLPCIITDLTPSVFIDACDQSRTQQSSLKLPTKKTVSVLHLGDAYLQISGSAATAVPALAPDPLAQTTRDHAGRFEGSGATQQNVALGSSPTEINIRTTPERLVV